jgi:DNA polymerase sigma
MIDTNFSPHQSSLISRIVYDDNEVLIIHFRKYYVESYTYFEVPVSIIEAMFASKSIGKFYLANIKNKFLTKQKQEKMADKVIKISIDVKKLKKEWLHVGEKGTYLNATLLYNEEQDQFGNNGMIVQDVPKKIYEAEKKLAADKKSKGPILGNGKVWANELPKVEGKPGEETGTMGADDDDDLPF